jgi:2-polyprenyl-3-methyl-5-hydroxy-6-metoxy-1,4-benzoquinol methylase
MEDVAAAACAPLSYLGDRLGLFKVMASSGPLTPSELAQKTGLNLRYTRAWLEAMTVAEYIEYEGTTRKFMLPPEHAAVLVHEDSPEFMGGALEGTVPAAMITPKIQEAFRTGKGVSYSDYVPEMFESQARWSATGFQHELVQRWIPAMPHVLERLRDGGTAVDIGCGRGVASIVLAKAFPRSRFMGCDLHGPSIERARADAANEGVADRVVFEAIDGANLTGRQFDLVTTFDVLHDSADPAALVRAARRALKARGTYLASEPNFSPKLEDNRNPWGRMFYAASLLYCISVSLGQGGPGIGSDINAQMVEQWGQAAGFKRIRTLPIGGGGFTEMRL